MVMYQHHGDAFQLAVCIKHTYDHALSSQSLVFCNIFDLCYQTLNQLPYPLHKMSLYINHQLKWVLHIHVL